VVENVKERRLYPTFSYISWAINKQVACDRVQGLGFPRTEKG